MALRKRLLPRNEEGIDDYVGMQFKTSNFIKEVFTVASFSLEKNLYYITYVDKSYSIVTVTYGAKLLRKKLKDNDWTLIN
tara:strand:+ start:722 stop:961 length:240 start_codon:yes stop_codon:yes gene_type:complete